MRRHTYHRPRRRVSATPLLTATYVAGGPSKLIGLATITDAHGNDVPEPPFEFDGAFDPDS